MKLLEVNKFYSPWIGGIETVVQQLAEGLQQKSDFDVTVLCFQPHGPKVVEIKNHVRIVRTRRLFTLFKMPFSFSFFKDFKRLAKSSDIIDLHHPFPLGFLAYLLYNSSKSKLVVHYHSDIVRQKISGFLITPLLKAVLKRAAKIIISNPALLLSSPLLKKFATKCEVVPFGVDVNEINQLISIPEVEGIKKKYGSFVLYAGRLSYYKGVKYLIEAMRGIDKKLIIIGEGKEYDSLKIKIQELNLQNQIIILPPQLRATLINFFKAAEVLVLPSIYKSEAFGIVLIEAMACGTPVISTELGTGTSYVNRDEQTGFVVPIKDSDKLRQAIQKIFLNPEIRTRMSRAANERVQKEFSLDKIIKQHQYVFKELL